MLKQQNTKKDLALFLCCFFVLFSSTFANDSHSENFSIQSATGLGSNNSQIQVDANLSYYNAGDNSTIIGNYFQGYYYDSVLGYFQVNWSTSINENIRIVSSTSACVTGFGYKLGGYAYSEYFGFVDFDYDDTTFVYYCLDDKKLHGYSYNADLGFQDFSGIGFEIEADIENPIDLPDENEDFINDGSTIVTPEPPGGNPAGTFTENSNFSSSTIQNNIVDFDISEESLFYIIK